MSGIQAYKAHKQEGTIAATTLVVSKVHKQGHLRIPKHPYISGCMLIVGYANSIQGYGKLKKTARLFDMHNNCRIC